MEFSSPKQILEFFKNEDVDKYTIRIIPKNYPEARTRTEAKGYELDRKMWEDSLKLTNNNPSKVKKSNVVQKPKNEEFFSF